MARLSNVAEALGVAIASNSKYMYSDEGAPDGLSMPQIAHALMYEVAESLGHSDETCDRAGNTAAEYCRAALEDSNEPKH